MFLYSEFFVSRKLSTLHDHKYKKQRLTLLPVELSLKLTKVGEASERNNSKVGTKRIKISMRL